MVNNSLSRALSEVKAMSDKLEAELRAARSEHAEALKAVQASKGKNESKYEAMEDKLNEKTVRLLLYNI